MVGGSKLVGGLLLLLPRSLGFPSPSLEESEGGLAQGGESGGGGSEEALRALTGLERLLINSTLSVSWQGKHLVVVPAGKGSVLSRCQLACSGGFQWCCTQCVQPYTLTLQSVCTKCTYNVYDSRAAS